MTVGSPSDEWSRLRAGAADAAARLVARHRDRLLRVIAARLDPRVAAKVDPDDVLQEVYLEASRRGGDASSGASVPVFIWLRQLAVQAVIDTHRRYLGAEMRDVRREVRIQHPAGASASSLMLAGQLAGSVTTPSRHAMREELVERLRALLEGMSETDREVLVLRHLEGLSNDEAAAVLGVGKYAASKRYVRALERLRRRLAAEGWATLSGD